MEWLVTIIAIYIAFGLIVFLMQRWLIFPSYMLPKDIRPLPQNALHIELQVDDGVVLRGYKLDRNASKLLLCFGGNAQEVSSFMGIFQDVAPAYEVITFNYRGYGRSGGSPSTEKIAQDALKIYDAYASKYSEVSTLGFSLGASSALFLSGQRDIQETILVGPYDSLLSIAKNTLPIYPVSLMLRENFDNMKFAESVKNPVTVVMIDGDIQVRNIQTRNLLPHIGNLKELIVIDDTTHTGVLFDMRFAQALQRILR